MKSICIFVLLVLGACVPVATGGVGVTSTGQPVSGQLSRDGSTPETRLLIVSPSGWQCEGRAADLPPGSNTAIRTIPVSCSSGASGNVVLTGNQFQDQIVGSFQLANGQSGQITFGRT